MSGARSVSDFTRSVACGMNGATNGSEKDIDKIDGQLRVLNERVEALDRSLRVLTDELREKSPNSSDQLTSKEQMS